MNKAQLKEAVCKAIDARFEDVENWQWTSFLSLNSALRNKRPLPK